MNTIAIRMDEKTWKFIEGKGYVLEEGVERLIH